MSDNVVVPFYSTTTDIYITITVHNDWELRTFSLETVPMFLDHAGQNIADTV
jgi:hypothetical protein